MKDKKYKQICTKIFGMAGITINGKNPWDIQVRDEKFYRRVLTEGSLGLGESYMDGWWTCAQIDEMINRILRARLNKKSFGKDIKWSIMKAKVFNMQNKSRAYIVGKKHYDVGNELYKLMLDKSMVYSCGYWKNAKTLDTAQEAKLDLICKKVGLKKGMNVLDIGCGWGGFAKFAAKKYGVKVVGITISKEQAKLARENCKGLLIEIRLQDYRDLNEKFDRIISIGMFEHVGPKNYREYMKVVHKNLKKDGLFLLHTIGFDISKIIGNPWLTKYIFPNGTLPSPKDITRAADGFFSLQDWHNFPHDYDKTLIEWNKNFQKNWSKIKNNYDERFKRMWEYYLLSNAGAFRAETPKLWQIVFSKRGNPIKYISVR